ncbi:hypothetical protein H5410_062704 [Solanum commersonii]|uniref:Uncharacterized protein n=1 Tax=Solanum commersonii TaxID=4109 RepID=A0A9J5WBK1_SOLCO|nr:hypothetical protein H5410_062704 [Solanum commersonii]
MSSGGFAANKQTNMERIPKKISSIVQCEDDIVFELLSWLPAKSLIEEKFGLSREEKFGIPSPYRDNYVMHHLISHNFDLEKVIGAPASLGFSKHLYELTRVRFVHLMRLVFSSCNI